MTTRRLYRGGRQGGRVSKSKPAPRVLRERGAPLHAEVVSTGRELVRGVAADTNGRFLAASLTSLGGIVHRVTAVDDRARAVSETVLAALERGAGLVVTSGGLGPTRDDQTLEGVAEAVGTPLEFQPAAKELIEGAYARLKASGFAVRDGMTRAREKLCAVPVGAELVPNPLGISPAVICRLPAGATVVSLPGRPRECAATWSEVASRLRDLRETEIPRARREAEAPTADESSLEPLLERIAEDYPHVWVQTHVPPLDARHRSRGVRLTFESTAATPHEAEQAVEAAMQRLLSLTGSR